MFLKVSPLKNDFNCVCMFLCSCTIHGATKADFDINTVLYTNIRTVYIYQDLIFKKK